MLKEYFMKYKGYTGRLLLVDLTAGKITYSSFSEMLAEKYIGGVGVAAALIAENIPSTIDPFSSENPLIFMAGPLTGTIIPWSGRHCVAAVSPLTGLWGESYAGGTWGRELKKAGLDGLVLTGKADSLAFIKIADRRVSIEDAASLRGRDTYETETIIRQMCGGAASVAAIGLAGENRVRFASILHDGKAARAAGRCGLGAVMGSKNLKAIAVKGSGDIPLFDREGLQTSIRKVMPELINSPDHHLKKALGVFSMFLADRRYGINNWRDGDLQGFSEAFLKELENHARKGKPYLCAGCRTGCVESHVQDGERQNVWESVAPLGSQCGIIDMDCIQKAYALCNRHGIDSISTGGVVSFAMECFEAGILSRSDTDGLDLSFGSGTAMLTLLQMICERNGIGSILAEGTRKAAQILGPKAEPYAIEVKGLEVPAHDPRAHNFLALAYATDNRGAIHTGAADPKVEGFDLISMADIRFNVEGTAEMVARGQDYGTILNSLVLCAFSHAGYAQYNSAMGFPGITAREVVAWFRLATGMEVTFDSLMQSGERIVNLKRLINLKLGMNPGDDNLPKRFLTVSRKSGPDADPLPPIEKLLSDYYQVRGWDGNGRISDKKLTDLGLG
jgi:aldehyde:ferredoxin oxidoreductase